jgi:hypothetical protein
MATDHVAGLLNKICWNGDVGLFLATDILTLKGHRVSHIVTVSNNGSEYLVDIFRDYRKTYRSVSLNMMFRYRFPIRNRGKIV